MAIVLLLALVVDVVAARAVLHNASNFYLCGPLGVVLAVGVAMGLSPTGARAHALVAAMAGFGCVGAMVSGVLFASCDPATDVFIAIMVAVLGTIPFVASGWIFAAIPGVWAGGRLARWLFPGPPRRVAYILVAAACIAVGILAFAAALAHGVRPTPTACLA